MLARPARQITELGGAENSFLRMRGKLRRSAGSGMLKDDPLMRGAMLALPIRALESGELIPQNENRKFPPNLGQVKFTVVTGELERNERACLSLTLAAGGGGA